MSDLRSEIVSKVLNSWESAPPQVKTEEVSIAQKVFDFVNDHPSCTVNDIVAGTSIDLARTAATTLALYQRGKLDRKQYPNPDPNGKHAHVYAYWTAVNNYTDKGVKRLMPKKAKKVKEAKPVKEPVRLITPTHEHLLRPRMPQAFNPETLIQDLSLREAKQLFETLKGYFGG